MGDVAMKLLLDLSRFTAQAFVAGLWQGIVLTSAAAICLRLLPRLSASIRFIVWAFTFVLVVTFPLLHLHIIALQQTQPAVIHVGAVWGSLVAGLWLLLMAARAIQLLVQVIHMRRIWGRAKSASAEDATLALLQSGRRTVELCTSADVDSPSVIGFFSPRLLIPEQLFAKLTEPELRQIVMHECEHLRRRDDWVNLLQKIGLVLFPLNPSLLWMDRRLSLERELACDAGVVASTAAPFDYAHCLTSLAEHRIRCRRVALLLSAWSRQSELAWRVRNLIQPVRTMSLSQARLPVVLVALGLVGGALEMARVPHLVSFSDGAAQPVEQAAVPVLTPATVQVQPVVYCESAQPHATLLKDISLSTARPILQPQEPPIRLARKAGSRRVSAIRVQKHIGMVLKTASHSDPIVQNRRLSREGTRSSYL